MLNSSAAVPLYVQLKEKIEQKISDGEYKPGEKLQTEGEMAKSFGVSIITVRKAVSELVEKGSQVIYISRVRYADGMPMAIERNYFPLKYAFLLEERFDDNSLFTFLKEHSHTAVAISEKWIELCKATAAEAELLQMAKGTSMLFIKSVAYTAEKEPIYVGHQVFNGEKCSFYVCESTIGIE